MAAECRALAQKPTQTSAACLKPHQHRTPRRHQIPHQRQSPTPTFSGQAVPIFRRGPVRGCKANPTGQVCPVSLSDLRYLTFNHWGFDGGMKQGRTRRAFGCCQRNDRAGAARPLRCTFSDSAGAIGWMTTTPKTLLRWSGEQHVSVQLPSCNGRLGLVNPRLWPLHRHQPTR